MSRDVVLFLEDIEASCAKVISFTEGRERDEVFADAMRFDAVLRNLHVIGEAVKSLPPELRDRHADVPWRAIAGLRDIVAHAYFALDLDILWNAIQVEIPALLIRIRRILDRDGE